MRVSRRAFLAGTLGSSTAVVAGCSGEDGSATPAEPPAIPPQGGTYAYTHVQASGNRVVGGGGDVREVEPVALSVDGQPAWLLAVDGASGTLWTVVTAAGTAETHRVRNRTSELVTDHGAVWTPPLGQLRDGSVTLLGGGEDVATQTHPVPLEDGLCYVAGNGDVVLHRGDDPTRLDVAAPPDARIVAGPEGQYVCYGARTDRYRHGALGDTTEGSSLVLVDPGTDSPAGEIPLDEPAVFEGLSPLVADVDGDGTEEIVTTIASSSGGARIRVYDAAGSALATGPVYGPGWRHQLCVAPFAPDGTPEIAVVRKPHVDHTLEFYRLVDGALEVAATHGGYASHTYGSRNLDEALAADLTGGGRPVVLVPTTDRETLAAVRRTQRGAERAFELDLGGALTTNLTGVGRSTGGLAVGAGTAEGVLVWQS